MAATAGCTNGSWRSLPNRLAARESLRPRNGGTHVYRPAFPSARSRSAITSSGCSPPTQSRTMLGGNVGQLAALLALLLVRRDGGDRGHALDAPQIGGPPDPLEPVEHLARGLGAAAHAERKQVPVAVHRLAVQFVVLGVDQPQVAAGQLVQRMVRAARDTARSRRPDAAPGTRPPASCCGSSDRSSTAGSACRSAP